MTNVAVYCILRCSSAVAAAPPILQTVWHSNHDTLMVGQHSLHVQAGNSMTGKPVAIAELTFSFIDTAGECRALFLLQWRNRLSACILVPSSSMTSYKRFRHHQIHPNRKEATIETTSRCWKAYARTHVLAAYLTWSVQSKFL